MKRISATRGLGFALVIGVAGVCAGVAGAQHRNEGGGGRSSYRGGGAPSYHQQMPSYQRMPGPSYREPVPQAGYRQPAPQGYRGYAAGPQPYYGRSQGMPVERYGQEQSPAPVERRQPNQQQYQGQQPYRGQMSQVGPQQPRNPQGTGLRSEHLPQWMNQHRNLTPQQQQQALSHEPGFNQLPQQTQDRMRNRLAQLNAMPPERRQRILEYNERMEHLSVNPRAEVRGSLQQLGSLPEDQRREVARSFRELRALPPNQRGAALNSPQYQYMNPAQRNALNNLLRVEPLLPPSEQQQR